MQSKPIAVIVVLLLVVTSLLVSGCIGTTPSPTPTAAPPTPTPIVDYSNTLAKYVESSGFIIERPFTKSTNERGNDVYMGVGRNATSPGIQSTTIVIEFTKSQTEAKRVYGEAVNNKVNDGYTLDSASTTKYKSNNPTAVEAWIGVAGGVKVFACSFYYFEDAGKWIVDQESYAIS